METKSTGAEFFRPTWVRGATAVVLLLILTSLLAPWLAPQDPIAQLDLAELQNKSPSWTHPFGTDFYSRDVLSRVIWGSRVSLSIASLSILLSITIGTAVGVLAGLAGGWIDTVIMRAVDGALAIPRVFLLLLVLALWEVQGLMVLVVALGATSWFGTSRIVRAEVLSLKSRPFLEAARSLGLTPTRTMFRHLLPNLAGPVIVTATLGIGQMILLEAGLSYLGLGIPEPLPSWGNMIRDGQSSLATAPWTAAFPGGAIVVTVGAVSLLGDRLRELLDPRST